MKPLLRRVLAVLFAVFTVLGSTAFAVDLPGPLVDTQWLAANLKQKGLVVLDVRVEKDGKAFGYVPGSRLWNWDTVRVDRKIDGIDLESMVPTKGSSSR
jgi:thiosulfate/3-mercaptopyruvate sulfurtransferase